MNSDTLSFVYQSQPARVVFGRGTSDTVEREAEQLGLRRVLVLSTPEQAGLAQKVSGRLGARSAGVFSGAQMHTPLKVTQAALEQVAGLDVDGVVSVGGGSTIGLGKAIALRTDLPQIVIPTTYAGSEMTPLIGETVDGVKRTQRDPKVLPEVVLYDVDLTLSLPLGPTAASALNAIAHAAEALYAADGNPVLSLMAEEGVRALARALPRLVEDERDLQARSAALYGAWLCAGCLGACTMGLHHKLCHTLGGLFDLPHAQMHAVLLPYALAYNAASISDALERLARATGAADPLAALRGLAAVCGLPSSLRELGMPREGIAAALQLALANPYRNPRPVEGPALEELLQNAWSGAPA
ncbi:MAG TPA: maleylacetate reductase [Ramlibacter sp.]|nr:maleylacetate reductase [Ramlibacter sp.]